MIEKSAHLCSFPPDYYTYPANLRDDSLVNALDVEQKTGSISIKVNKLVGKVGSHYAQFGNCEDSSILESCISNHGIFARSFFNLNVRPRVNATLTEMELDGGTYEKLLTSSAAYNPRMKSQTVRTVLVDDVLSYLYQTNLSLALRKEEVYESLSSWFGDARRRIGCVLCRKRFRLINLPNWVYFGSNGFKKCCFRCNVVEFPKKAELPTAVREFIDHCGFIPKSDASPLNIDFTSRLNEATWPLAILSFAKMGRIDHVIDKFGSWFEALVITKALPNGVQATARGIRCLAIDGHVCHSLDEQRIDDWLHENQLQHEREPLYPSDALLNPTGRRRADWRVGDTFIEYFGLLGDKTYDQKMGEKLALADRHNFKLLSIFPKDIRNLDVILNTLKST